GFGSDGGNWGGELLLCEETSSQRIGHLAPLQIPGGDRAAREPWRMASAVLHGLGRGNEIGQRFAAQRQAGCLSDLLDQPGGTTTTSAGRLFDAAAALLGIANLQSYDGEAALKLEALVRGTTILEAGWTIEGGVLSLGPLFSRLIADDIDAAGGAGLFHGTLAAACVDWVTRSARTTGINTVVLSGGCFLNAVLADKIPRGCSDAGLTPLVPRRLPPNDGGLSLGQAWIAALKIAQQPPAGQELPDMCLSVPAKIAKILPNEMALVFIDGANLEISIALLDELDVGDFVLVHVGYALAKIDPAEAKRTLELLQELGAAKECRS
ncbi:HypC/HybG/HupF family hydrogenase formation chaperone, partial [Bradyrhizobium ottawaense]